MGFSQSAFAAFGGVGKMAQIRYEKGERRPDAAYFEGIAKAGADITYIVTGEPRALRESLQNIKVATGVASRVADDPAAVAALQGVLFESLQAARGDEVKLLFDYRRCSPPDQKTIRQMATRLAVETPATSGPDAVADSAVIEVKQEPGAGATRKRARKTGRSK